MLLYPCLLTPDHRRVALYLDSHSAAAGIRATDFIQATEQQLRARPGLDFVGQHNGGKRDYSPLALPQALQSL